jgi:flagellar biosynthesis/type III secretory pathway chaperone
MQGIEVSLQALRDQLAAFTEVLEAEAKALEHLQADNLGPLVDTKQRLSLAVASAWARLNDIARGDPQLREEVERGASSLPARERLWREIRQLAKRAEQVNAGNGQLIEAQLRRTRQALDILQRASSRGGVYGANGQMLDFLSTTRRTFDKA